MSISALILMQTVARRDELDAQHGRNVITMTLFATAARLIAGGYES